MTRARVGTADGMHRRIDLTQYVTIPIWYGCNNNCTICMLAGLKKKLPFIDFETFKNLDISLKKEGKYENLVLSGAEVTTFPELGEYVRFAASLGWFKKIQIQTNGRRLSDRAYLETLIDSGVNEFFVSIQGLEGDPRCNHEDAGFVQGDHGSRLQPGTV